MAPLYDDVTQQAPSGLAGTDSRKSLSQIAHTLAGTLRTWRRRAVERRQLLELDSRLLADIGLTHADALAEAGKPVWKA